LEHIFKSGKSDRDGEKFHEAALAAGTLTALAGIGVGWHFISDYSVQAAGSINDFAHQLDPVAGLVEIGGTVLGAVAGGFGAGYTALLAVYALAALAGAVLTAPVEGTKWIYHKKNPPGPEPHEYGMLFDHLPANTQRDIGESFSMSTKSAVSVMFSS